MGFSCSSTSAALLYSLALIAAVSCSDQVAAPVGSGELINVTPTLLEGSVPSRENVRCARVSVSGLSRLQFGSYSSAHRITLVPSDEIQEKSYKKIQICVHGNSSVGLCQCQNDEWESVQSGVWSTVVSPYKDRYIDVKFVDNLSGSVTVAVKLEFHKWRLLFFAVGVILLLLAPIVSSWVPFYYSSSMAIGVCLVVIIILFQGMKLLPTGRKNALYSSLCGLALGAGSFLLNRFAMFVNSILVNFGISAEMHNPMLVFLLIGIVLAGAAFGYWFVRKFIVGEDGSVVVGVAQFVKWSLRVIAVAFLLQSTIDTPLATTMLIFLLAIYFLLTSFKWRRLRESTYTRRGTPPNRRSIKEYKYKRAEFLSRSGSPTSRQSLWKIPKNSPAWSNSPVKGILSTPSSQRHKGNLHSYMSTPSTTGGSSGSKKAGDYYSTFHRTPNRKKFSKEEWNEFTEESTRQALAEWASTPEFTDWIMNHADRIQLQPDRSSDDESIGSDSENDAPSSSGRGLFW